MKRIFLLIIVCFLSYFTVSATSIFVLKSADSLLVAKSYVSANQIGYLVVNPRNELKQSMANGYAAINWKSIYGSVTFNQLSKDFPIGGMNEKGLVVELISTNEMSISDENKLFSLSEFETVQYLLDNCADIEEFVKVVERINVVPFYGMYHFFATDTTGNSCVVEFIRGEIVINSLTSNPNYLPILSTNIYEKSIGAVLGDKPRVNRGDKNFSYLADCDLSYTENVDFMLSALQNKNTVWNIIYDLHNNSIKFKSKGQIAYREIDVNICDFDSQERSFIDINSLTQQNINFELKDLSQNDNIVLMTNSFKIFDIEGFSDSDIVMLEKGSNIQRTAIFAGRAEKLKTLKVKIDDLDSDRGFLKAYIYSNKNDFDNRIPYREVAYSIYDKSVELYFYNLPSDGQYAIYYFHDENSNGKVDRQWVGLPKEDNGYSGRNGRSFENALIDENDFIKGEYYIKNSSFLFW